MGMNIVNGRVHAHNYRTGKTPPEAEILEILQKQGIA
jgi:hypothetical protein